MAARKAPAISTRKEPKQARSSALVSDVLTAARQVLAREGATRFTMARVATKAGVSVGSLYQYFPNKASILFRLQSDEWRETKALLRAILEDTAKPPELRLRTLVHAFLKSECDEADVRTALSDAAPYYRDAPEAVTLRADTRRTMLRFTAEALPGASPAKRMLVAEVVKSTLSAVGKEFSAQPRTPREIDRYAGAIADMLCAYLAAMRARAHSK